MKRTVKAINLILPFLLMVATLFVLVAILMQNYNVTRGDVLIMFGVGAIIAGFFHALFHELGHLIAGKINDFAFSEMVVWFFRWRRVGKHVAFGLVMIGEQAGYTQMLPTKQECVEKGLKSMTLGGVIASFVWMLFGLAPLLFVGILPVWLFAVWSMFLPIGIYYFLGNGLPKETLGVRNDGAVILGLIKNDDQAQVTINLLKIQAQLYNGKTPSQIDEGLYFNLPQLAEDKLEFAMLLSARYAYYLDKEDYENAKKTTQRLLSLEDYLSKENLIIVKADALYNSCTFDYNEETADDLMYELEDYLNAVNSATNLRIKLAYLVCVVKEYDEVDMFVSKGQKEAKKHQLGGLGLMEQKLLYKLKNMIK